MDNLFCEIDYRSKSDSIVMKLLRSAMDKAHEKVQSKDGPIEFLHERSKFYELAAILVEGGLKIVQEEADVVEDNRDKILSDLMELRHWLQGRIKDMKHLIVKKDKELTERLENESKLRHSLELKERELLRLHEKLEPGRMKIEGLQDFLMCNEAIENRATEGDICELKNSLDQQVLNIKQKLEDEHKIFKNDSKKIISRVSSPDMCSGFIDEEIHGNLGFKEKEFGWDDKFSRIIRAPVNSPRPESNTLIRWMSSDIDDLKQTLDLAFGRMQSAELLPLEKQWRWTIEKDIESILVKGFTTDIQKCFEAEVAKGYRINLGDQNDVSDRYEVQGIRLPMSERKTETKKITSLKQEIRKLETDRNDLSLLILLMEDANQVLFRGLVEDVNSKLCLYDTERLIDDDNGRRSLKEFSHYHQNASVQMNHDYADSEFDDSTSGRILWQYLESSVREDLYVVFIQEIVEECKKTAEHFTDESISENVKDLHIPFKRSKSLLRYDFSEDTPRSRKTDGDERFIEKLDCLTKCLEAEEELMLRASSEIKAHSVKNDIVILDCEETEERKAIEWLLTDDESTFSSVGRKLEGALQQLHTSRELVVELEQSLEISDDLEENDHDLQLDDVLKIEHEKKLSNLRKGDTEFNKMIPSDTVLSTIIRLQQVLLDFEIRINQNLDMKSQRLEALTGQVDTLIEPVASIRKTELLYKKAFVLRCHNLKLAESEVDLLGDQVDTLLLLLEKIYFELNQNAYVLSRYFGVFEVLKLIKRELTHEASGKPKS